MQLNSRYGDIQMNLFPDTYDNYGNLLVNGTIVAVRGTIRIQNDNFSVNVSELYDVMEYLRRKARRLKFVITADDDENLRNFLKNLAKFISENLGDLPITLEIQKNNAKRFNDIDESLSINLNLPAIAPLMKSPAFRDLELL
jgi:DNA polymerase III alpha subunit